MQAFYFFVKHLQIKLFLLNSIPTQLSSYQISFVNYPIFRRSLLHFNADKQLESVKLAQNTKHDFYLIFKEALNNCAKYSEAKNVYIVITLKGHILCLDIRDDGKGFDMNKIKRGNGLFTMEKRAEAMKGKWILESFPGSGTHLDLKINIP